MSGYVQIEVQDGYITRGISIDKDSKIDGYPGYKASITWMRSSVRTILYIDNDRIYCTSDKTFMLVDGWIFSSCPYAEPILLSSLQYTVYPWHNEWANMNTDLPTRNNLVWPYRTWEEAWTHIYNNRYRIMIERSDKKKRIGPVDSFGGSNFVTAAFKWTSGDPALFYLEKKGNEWGLRYDGNAIGDAEKPLGSGGRGIYVKSWSYGKSNRWLLTSSISNALFFSVTSIDDKTYRFSYNDRQLTEAGCWTIAFGKIGICKLNGVLDGVEFYNNNKPPIDLYISIVEPSLSELDKYLLDQYFFLMRDKNNELLPYEVDKITINRPYNDIICSSTWDGSTIGCYKEQVPYTYGIGIDQCTTIDDMNNDTHCQQWAIANRGIDMDTKMKDLCKNIPIGVYDNVCSCYYDDAIYYNTIVQQRRNDREMGIRIADDVKRTNLLQCTSGLCSGGNISSSIFYHGSKKCDICIQAARINIQADRIEGDTKLKQICSHIDSTYTWNDLIIRLIDLGAYDTSTRTGIHDHVIINTDRSAIKLMMGEVLNDIPILLSITNRDSDGNIIITRDQWSRDPTKYSDSILLYFLDVIM